MIRKNQSHFRKHVQSALNGSFHEITIENEDFSIASLMYQDMETEVSILKAKTIFEAGRLQRVGRQIRSLLR